MAKRPRKTTSRTSTHRSSTRAARGLFIVFEGGEGCGKSTQIQHLRSWFEAKGHTPLVTREPGGTPVGEQLRHLVVEHRSAQLADRAELLIYEASRAQHVETVIRPALDRGQVVLCDRFMDSSTVYQGLCKGLGRANTEWLNRFATAGVSPDIVFLLDLPETIAAQRLQSRTEPMNHWDRLGLDFHKKVRQFFLSLARTHAKRYAVIDASAAPEEITEKLVQVLQKRFKKRL